VLDENALQVAAEIKGGLRPRSRIRRCLSGRVTSVGNPRSQTPRSKDNDMSRLLYIKASPRGAASKSSAVADAYLAALREQLLDLIVDTLDLAQEKIPTSAATRSPRRWR